MRAGWVYVVTAFNVTFFLSYSVCMAQSLIGSPQTVSLGTSQQGIAGEDSVVAYTNNGSTAISIQSLTLDSPDNGVVQDTSSRVISIDPLLYTPPPATCTPGTTLPPGYSCYVYLHSSATAPLGFSQASSVTVSYTDQNQNSASISTGINNTVVAQGYLSSPYLYISEPSVSETGDMGLIDTRSVSVFNYGGAPLTIGQVDFNVTQPVSVFAPFTSAELGNVVLDRQNSTCLSQSQIETSQSCTFVFEVEPPSIPGMHVGATVTFVDNANNLPNAGITFSFTSTLPAAPVPSHAPDDHHFYADAWQYPVCTRAGEYGTRGFGLEITRFVGPVDANGALLMAPEMISNGVISPIVQAQVDIYNSAASSNFTVNLNGVSAQILAQNSAVPGWSSITVAFPVTALLFADRGRYPVSTRDPSLADPNVIGCESPGDSLPTNVYASPSPRLNTVKISGTPNPNIPQGVSQNYCFAGITVNFAAASPTLLIHGNGDDGNTLGIGNPNGVAGFFGKQQFNTYLDSIGAPYDDHIDMSMDANPVYNGSPEEQACLLGSWIPQLAMSFGVQSVNIIAHSKGGISTRAWLGGFGTTTNGSISPGLGYFPGESSVRVESFVTLDSPHEGSVLADLAAQGYQALDQDLREGLQFPLLSINIDIDGIPIPYTFDIGSGAPLLDNVQFWSGDSLLGQYNSEFQDTVLQYAIANHGPPDAGDLNLGTAAMERFNSTNIPGLPTNVAYTLFGANADLNCDEILEQNEWSTVADSEGVLANLPSTLQDIALNTAYQLLQRVGSVSTIQIPFSTVMGAENEAFASLAQAPNAFVGNDDPGDWDYLMSMNDLAVTARSATAYDIQATTWFPQRYLLPGNYSGLPGNRYSAEFPPLGANHQTIASPQVAQAVWFYAIQYWEVLLGEFSEPGAVYGGILP